MNDEQKSKIVVPTQDRVFKLIFGNKGREEILKSFLESILEIKIDSLKLGFVQEILGKNDKAKGIVLDVRARLSNGTKVNIEIQNSKKAYSDKRCLMYWSRLYSDYMKKEMRYDKLKKTICIWIINDECYKEFPEYISKWEMTSKNHPDVEKFSDIEFYIIELKKFRKSAKIEESVRDSWLAFIDYTDKELIDMACLSNEQIQNAKKALEEIRADDALCEKIFYEWLKENDQYNRDEMRKAEEKKIAKKEKKILEKEKSISEKERNISEKERNISKQEKRLIDVKKQLVSNLLKADMTVEQIVSISGFSKEELDEIIKSIET